MQRVIRSRKNETAKYEFPLKEQQLRQRSFSVLDQRNLKTQLSFFGYAYCPHQSNTKTGLYKNVLQTGRNCKRRLCVFVWIENISKTELFDGVTITCDFPDRGLLIHKSKMTSDCCVFKFLQGSVDRSQGRPAQQAVSGRKKRTPPI